MKKALFILPLLALLGTSIAKGAEPTPAEKDSIRNYEFFVDDFERIVLTDSVNVVYHCVPDSAGYVHYSGTAEFDDAFIFTNNKGKLRIQVFTDDVDKPGLPTLHIYSSTLKDVQNGSTGRLVIDKPASVDNFKAVLIGNGSIAIEDLHCSQLDAELHTGNGTLSLTGLCDKAKYVILGTGTIQCDNMHAQDVFCRIMGSGVIGCSASNSLKVRGLGSTKVFYRGNPNSVIKKGNAKLIEIE